MKKHYQSEDEYIEHWRDHEGPDGWDEIDYVTGAYEMDMNIHYMEHNMGKERSDFIKAKIANHISDVPYAHRDGYNAYYPTDEKIAQWPHSYTKNKPTK